MAGTGGLEAAAVRLSGMELVITRNPDPDARLPYLLWVPLGDGLVFRTAGPGPRPRRCTATRCRRPTGRPIRTWWNGWGCARVRAAVPRSTWCWTEPGTTAPSWCSRPPAAATRCSGSRPRTRKQARPNVSTPTARAGGIASLEIVVDSHEQYAYLFADKPVRVVKRALACGDYAVTYQGRVVAAVERSRGPGHTGSLSRIAVGCAPRCGNAGTQPTNRHHPLDHELLCRRGFLGPRVR
jgi:hypothetical protein